ELLLELVGLVEVVRDRVLVAVGDEDERVAPRLDGLVDGVLDQRPVDDRQHFLGNGLGGGEKAGTEAGHWEHGLANAYGHQYFLAVRDGNATTVARSTGTVARCEIGWDSGTSPRSTADSVSQAERLDASRSCCNPACTKA